MRSFALILLLIGIVLITIGYTTRQIKCPPPRIEYRFVPRSFLDEQIGGNSLDQVSSIFGNSDPFFKQEDSNVNADTSNNFYSIESVK